jgi:hypothetical protein
MQLQQHRFRRIGLRTPAARSQRSGDRLPALSAILAILALSAVGWAVIWSAFRVFL